MRQGAEEEEEYLSQTGSCFHSHEQIISTLKQKSGHTHYMCTAVTCGVEGGGVLLGGTHSFTSDLQAYI